MKILIFLSHPAQFLFYKNTIVNLRCNKHDVIILIKSKDVLSKLLDELGWKYYNIHPFKRGKSKLSIIKSLLIRNYKLFKFVRKNKPDVLMGTDASLAHIGKLLNVSCITTLEDDYEVIKYLTQLTYPFTKHILVPQVCSVGKWNKKKIAYNGYMKLAYLHPNNFSPNKSKVKLNLDTPFFLIRLSGLSAHHDYDIKGINFQFLDEIIEKLSKKGEVYISSENKLPDNYAGYQLVIPVSDIHHYLSFAELLICDSQSMSVEAAMLGTPSIRISDFAGRISVLEELEKEYGLTYGYKPDYKIGILSKLDDFLNKNELRTEFQFRRQHMLSEKIDVTQFLTWFIENYPKSVKIMKENPDYQYRFK